ncbi:ATP-binding protein [Belliella kenyensis]|uniref:ATP-binding protein n=1 Tax=Belliella kenyensis TaxID=1472724 RepID=A0ABV8EK34_9BACT|nr:ATP-binding protein [Belliella kenyensis]MCH7402346.1 ATP-binding protein [Belliella kenyensis]MDN3603538.1 ATP-binding protein [Belliella kenyensis]
MKFRRIASELEELLQDFPAVSILGPRQVGKTTLAQEIAIKLDKEAIYLDLESPSDRTKLVEPEQYFDLHLGKLIILDQIQQVPELYPILRGVIDKRRKAGYRHGQFLILGSASLELIKQSSESLAGRIAYEELFGFNLTEVSGEENALEKLWLRGGFPDSFLARSNPASLRWRNNFISTYLERDIPQIAQFIPANRLRRLWTMLAHQQGCQINMSQLGASMDLSSPTIKSYIELLEDLLLIRSIRPWHRNVGKRLVKSPKIYIRDSGLVHALLHIGDMDDLLSHPILGMSWEGFIIENILSELPKGAEYWYYRTFSGAEIDLVITYKTKVIAIEIKKTLSPKISKGFSISCEDIMATDKYFVYGGSETYPIGGETLAVSLQGILNIINEL